MKAVIFKGYIQIVSNNEKDGNIEDVTYIGKIIHIFNVDDGL